MMRFRKHLKCFDLFILISRHVSDLSQTTQARAIRCFFTGKVEVSRRYTAFARLGAGILFGCIIHHQPVRVLYFWLIDAPETLAKLLGRRYHNLVSCLRQIDTLSDFDHRIGAVSLSSSGGRTLYHFDYTLRVGSFLLVHIVLDLTRVKLFNHLIICLTHVH